MKKNLFIILSTFLFFILITISCKPSKQNEFRKVEMPELIKRLKNNEVDLFKITYKDSLGNELSNDLRSQLNQGELLRDFYSNKENQITQIRVKKYSDENVFDEIQIRELLTNPFNSIKLISVKCEDSDSLILDAYEKDQNVRTGGKGDIHKIDSINQQLILSIIESCGWPDKPELVKSIFYIIQHADSGFMAFYYPNFKQSVSDSLLKPSTMALMEDRMLMNNGYPQIYGSQIVRQNVYQLRDPKNVNKRRAEIGLGTIEEYTRRFDFEYEEDNRIQ